LIVDDEQHCREYLSDLLGRYCPDIEVVGTAANVRQAVEKFQVLRPALIFLDIRMPAESGFDLLDHTVIRHSKPAIIFTTAYDQYAIKAFRYSAVDYLLKPVNIRELVAAVKKVTEHISRTDYSPLSELFRQPDKSIVRKLCFPTGSGFHLAAISSILYFKAEGSYSWVHFEDNKPIMVSKPVSFYAEILQSERFMRIHRSYLVNLNHIVSFKTDDDFLVLSDRTSLAVSKRKKPLLVKVIKEMAM
jgi:two-component system, LytTR family, response regulator